MHRRTCLVTGASSGIGAALAEEFAFAGWDLYLTARHEGRLAEVARGLREKYRVDVTELVEDLADPKSPRRIIGAIDRPLDGLVNCAGYAPRHDMLETPWTDHSAFLQTLLAAPTELALHYAQAMRQRGFGRILNISSVLGFLPPTGKGSLYGPVKAYMTSFSESLHASVASDGVHVTAVCPGFTDTPIFTSAGIEEQVKASVPRRFWQTPQAVAREAVRANEAGRVICVTGFHNRVAVTLFKHLPRFVARKILSSGGG
ncbi:MAG: SDR family NAD(P)-dependent oxidoreductase [Parvularcula sp.]